MLHAGIQGDVMDSVETNAFTIYLRQLLVFGSVAPYGRYFIPETGTASFYYSFNNKTYTKTRERTKNEIQFVRVHRQQILFIQSSCERDRRIRLI